MEKSPGVKMYIPTAKKKPQKHADDVCRLCGATFTDKRNKHNLIIGALQMKPPYTLALEELTGLIKTTDELRAVAHVNLAEPY